MASPTSEEASSLPVDTIRVLLVGTDDPAAVGAYALLSEAGFEVLSALNAARALEICRWSLRPIDVVLLLDGVLDASVVSDLPTAATSIQSALPCIHLTAREAADRQLLVQRVRRAAAH